MIAKKLERSKLYLQLSELLKDKDRWIIESYNSASELCIKQAINKIKLENYFKENCIRMNKELNDLKLIPASKLELDNSINHRLLFKQGDSILYYDVFK